MNSKINMEKVYFDECRVYDIKKIEDIIRKSFDYLEFELPKNKKILIKPNVLGPYSPEMSITTNPRVIKAIVNILLENKNKIIIGDSSGGLGIKRMTENSLVESQIKDLEQENVKVVSFDILKAKNYENKNNKVLKNINLTKYIDDIDYIINVPKLKSHQLTKFSGAVKNLYGCIPGSTKQTLHSIAPSPEEFSELLVELYSFIKPKIILNVMDGIIGIEGNGPGPSGKKKEIGIIAISKDAVALDWFCGSLITNDPEEILTNKISKKNGLTDGNIITNKSIKKIKFEIPKPINMTFKILYKHISKLLNPRLKLITRKCTRCAVCYHTCPKKAISMDPYPKFNRKKCIYCYCCHENCQNSAIELKENFILNTYRKIRSK